MSSLVLLGLMARTSPGASFVSTGPTASESLGTMSVPLLCRLAIRGRIGIGAWMGWSTDEADDESERSRGGV